MLVHMISDSLLIERDGVIDQAYLLGGDPHKGLYGTCGSRYAWGVDYVGDVHVVDVEARKRLIVETGSGFETNRLRFVFPARNRDILYIVQDTPSFRLGVLDCQSGAIRRWIELAGRQLDHWTEGHRELADGQIAVPLQKGEYGWVESGIAFIDTDTGHVQESYLKPTSWPAPFQSISPEGNYCLRADLALRAADSSSVLSRFFGSRSSTPKHFGRVYQLWTTKPLQFVRLLTAGWYPTEELMLEQTAYEDEQGVVRNYNIPLEARGEFYSTLARTTATMKYSPEAIPKQADFPSPYKTSDKDWSLLRWNWRGLSQKSAPRFAWSPDSQGIWHHTNGFVGYVGLDGASSRRTLLTRFGYSKSSHLLATQRPHFLEPLVCQRLRVRYLWSKPSGTAVIPAVFDGPEFEHFHLPIDQDNWREGSESGREIIWYYEQADKLKRRLRLVEIKVKSLEESDCIKAISDLQLELERDLFGRVTDGEMTLKFLLKGKRLQEADFFGHLEKSCPNSGEALKGLIEALAKIAGGKTQDLFSDGEKGIGLLSDAARALARLHPDPFDALKAYGDLMDREHEYSFVKSVVPGLIESKGWNHQMIDFAGWLIQAGFYNSIDYRKLWNSHGLRAALEQEFKEPHLAAGRLLELFQTHKRGPMEQGREFTYEIFERLNREISPTDAWSRAVFDAARQLPHES
jgi:hypothetical protein